jgi:hypothetical protein
MYESSEFLIELLCEYQYSGFSGDFESKLFEGLEELLQVQFEDIFVEERYDQFPTCEQVTKVSQYVIECLLKLLLKDGSLTKKECDILRTELSAVDDRNRGLLGIIENFLVGNCSKKDLTESLMIYLQNWFNGSLNKQPDNTIEFYSQYIKKMMAKLP